MEKFYGLVKDYEYHSVEKEKEDIESIHSPSLYSPPIPFNDEKYLVYITFFILGLGMLFPWNCFITANEYFKVRFKGTIYVDNFQNYFSITFMISNFLWVAFILFFLQGNDRSNVPRLNSKYGVIGGLLLNFFVFLSCIGISISDLTAYSSFYITIIMVLLCGASTAFVQNCVFSIVSAFPHSYTQGVLFGQALAGLVVVISQILTLLTKESGDEATDIFSLRKAAILYFSFASFVSIVALYSFFKMLKSPFFNHHSKVDIEEEDENEILLETCSSQRSFRSSSILEVFRKCWRLCFVVFFNLVITLSLFPSIVSLVHSVNRKNENSSRFFKDLFIPFAFLVFNAGDWLGRALPGLKFMQTKNQNLQIFFSIFRVIFYPLILFSNVILTDNKTGEELPRLSMPFWITSDVMYLLVVALFAISNGYVGSMAMMYGPEVVSNKHDKGKVATLMVFCLTLGLGVGSGFSFFARYLLEN